MRGRIRGITGDEAERLTDGWELASCAPDAVVEPAGLHAAALSWLPATVPSTAASCLRAAGHWSLDGTPRRFDAQDWWYRTSFRARAVTDGAECWLHFGGLATVADVWLNGELLLSSEGMFTAHDRRVDTLLRPENELVIRFRSLDALLAARRPRPRWRTPMVEHQQLRWFRTTLLGRTPGWSPPAQVVGPWREVRLEWRRSVELRDLTLRTDATGRCEVACRVDTLCAEPLTAATLVVSRDGREHRAALATDGTRWRGALVVADVVQWWPHTHGEPALYTAQLALRVGRREVRVDLGHVGFRTIAAEQGDGDFAIHVNGERIFCRGACWTPLDVVTLGADDGALDAAFDQLVACGMNMVRVGGTMAYESDAFLDRCDRHGVLLWQDLMFANMEYPGDDAGFTAVVRMEVSQQLARLAGRPALAVVCGNSEGEQQAAMWGAERSRWAMPLFDEVIATLVREGVDATYWPSSAHGGAFPHQGSVGTASYYGVGAYLQPLHDARRAEVRFATECLAFANVPDDGSLDRIPGGPGVKVHEAAWRTRAPRDLGAGWDFDDVRDHYLSLLFQVDPAALRYADHERYLALSREVTGEVMAATFAEWRRARSVTRGGLIWFLRDLWHGAGWGVVDAGGTPKAAWHHLRRALAPLALSISDEGTNGLVVHVVNERAGAWNGRLVISLVRAGEVVVGSAERSITVEARGTLSLDATTCFTEFRDLGWAYRFGPPSQDLVVAALIDTSGATVARGLHFVTGRPAARELEVGLRGTLIHRGDGDWDLEVGTRRLAYAVRVEIPGYVPDDDHFHVVPGQLHRVRLVRGAMAGSTEGPTGRLVALNAESPARVRAP